MEWLEFVANEGDIRHSLDIFNHQASQYQGRACLLLRQTVYWVYDNSSGKFGPNKLVAYKNMSFNRYENALAGDFNGAPHDGHAARLAIERILRAYRFNSDLVGQLIEWSNSLLGAGILDGLSDDKWKFVYLR